MLIFRRRYLGAIAIQAFGPLLMLCLSVAITQMQGSAVQGAFASARAWVDLVAAVGLFGLPQSVVLAVNRSNVSRSKLFVWAAYYALSIFPVVAAASWISKSFGMVGASFTLGFVAVLWVMIGIWRGLILTVDDGVRFNLITVIPTFMIIVFGSGVLLSGLPLNDNLEVVFSGAGAISLVICFLIARRLVYKSTETSQPPNYRQLFFNGIDVFALTVCGSLQLYVCYFILGHVGKPTDVGHMSIAILVLNALIFPFQSLSPMLLNRWSKSASTEVLSAGRHHVRIFAVLLFVFSTIAAVVAAWLSPHLFKVVDRPPEVMWLLLVSVVPALFARTTALRLASLGLLRFNSKVAVMQLVIFTFSFLGLAQIHKLQPILSAVIAWLVAEMVVAVVFSLKLRAVCASISEVK